jgi:hypothetical protein
MSRIAFAAARLAAAALLVFFSGCAASHALPSPASSAEGAGVVRSAQWTALVGPLSILAYGGLKGLTYTAHPSGDTFDYAEDVAVDFDRAVDMSTFAAHFTIAPAAPYVTSNTNFGKRVGITIRKTPGVTYTLTLHAQLRALDGTALANDGVFALTTPAVVTYPPRTHSSKGDPYRYGFLVHPTTDSVSGANASMIADIVQSAGAGFVRIDYTGNQIMTTPTNTNWIPSDKIVALFAARHVTMLPILEQYSTAAWQSNGAPYPAIYDTPDLYAQFVSTVVAHLRTVAPQITRVELFNEPNLPKWWQAPNPAYAATDGSAAAAYMLAGYAAAKAANPALTVVGPGFADGGGATDPRAFLTKMYASGCRTGTCWDVISVHPYAWIDPTYTVSTTSFTRFGVYKDLQAIAVANGDALPHVMLTEFSFSTVNEADGFDPQVQARLLAEGFNLTLRDLTVDGVVWTSVYAPGSDFWSRTSLTDAAYNPEPAYAAYRAYAVP